MKTTFVFLILMASVLFIACKSTKKSSSSVETANIVNAPSAPTNTNSALIFKPSSGVYVPGTEDLLAIQMIDTNVTLEKLKEGHSIYANGPCVNCHSAKNIYQYNETKWKDILNTMAPMAKLSEKQKDAVFKYVLAIKAVKSNGAN